jgi:hypothetical protein
MRARLLGCALLVLVAACSDSTQVTGPSGLKCGVTVENALHGSAPAGGATSTLTVTTTRDCTWSATSDASWLSITSGASGQGSGSISYSVSANGQSSQRRATLDVNGTPIGVVQDGAPCRFSVSPATATVAANGGKVTVAVESIAGCAWTAQSAASWIAISSTSGSGSGTITLDVGANAGDARSGTLSIAGNSVTVTQAAAACTFTVTPTSMTAPFGGAAATVTITVRAGCAWTASSASPWITIASGAAGTGPATVSLQMAANPGDARSGSVSIAGTTVSVTQAAAPCTFVVAPLSQSVPVGGAAGSATVTVRPGCTWTASSSAPWIAITSAAAGSGSGIVTFLVAQNPGPPRTGTLTIAGATFTVSQATVPCFYTIGPRTQFIGPDGGTGTSTITTGPTCPWTAEPNVPWITMIGLNTGIGDGRVIFAIGVNLGGARIGTVTIAGQTYTVNQDARR